MATIDSIPWQMRIESGLSAHFKQADGPSRPGTDWLIDVARGREQFRVRVRALLADDATKATRRDEQYQARTAMQYLSDELASGWHPSGVRDHVIRIGNPLGAPSDDAERPWWKFW